MTIETAQTLRQLADLDKPPDAAALLQRAIERDAVSALDVLTLRDLLALCNSPPREVWALILLMLDLLREGSLCLELRPRSLRRRLEALTGEADAALADAVIAWARGSATEPLLSREARAYTPLVLRTYGGNDYVYFQKYDHHERRLRARLDQLLRRNPYGEAADFASVLTDVLETHPVCVNGKALQLHEGQHKALELALCRPFCIICGGPGTGKTSIVLTLLRCLARLGVRAEEIALTAPTGRAAQRMADAVQSGLAALSPLPAVDAALARVRSATIHRLLRAGRAGFGYHEANPLPARVVVVDEVSMVDVCLMARLLAAVRDDARVVCLGDKDQLPSVEAGAVLADLVPASTDGNLPPRLAGNVAILTKSFRSEQHILEVAARVNAGDTTAGDAVPSLAWGEHGVTWPPPHAAGCFWIDDAASDPARLGGLLDAWATRHYRGGGAQAPLRLAARPLPLDALHDAETVAWLDHLFRLLSRARVLTPLREGPWGAAGINARLLQCLAPAANARAPSGLFAGVPVMITENDAVRGLFNGDVGLVLHAGDVGWRVVFQQRGTYVAHPLDALPPREPAFAITVHKSQGSEYDEVLLVLPRDANPRLLTRQIVYTGLTRARTLALLYGSRETFAAAVGRTIRRASGLSLWRAEGCDDAGQALR